MDLLCGKDMVALAATLAVKISDELSEQELCNLLQFLSLLKNNLEVIKCNGKKHRCRE